MHAGAGAHVDDVVGREDRFAIVLHHEDGVAEIAQADLRFDEARVVARVEADAGLVEDVQHADERRADLRGQANALPFAGRERLRAAIEREVVEPHVDEEPEARGHGLEERIGDRALARSERPRGVLGAELPGEIAQASERHSAELGDVFLTELHGQRFGAKAAPFAGVARAGDEEAADLVVGDSPFVRVRVGVVGVAVGAGREARFEAGDDAFVRFLLRAALRLLRAVVGRRVAEEDRAALFLGELRPRHVGAHAERFDGARQLGRERDGRATSPREHGPFAQRAAAVGDDALRIDDRARAEAVAHRAGAVRAVEREHARLDRRERDAAVDAREALAEPERLFAFGEHEEAPFAQLERELDAVGEPPLEPFLDDEAIDDDVEIVLLRAVERELVAEVDDRPVDARAHEPFAAQAIELELHLAFARAADRREHADA